MIISNNRNIFFLSEKIKRCRHFDLSNLYQILEFSNSEKLLIKKSYTSIALKTRCSKYKVRQTVVKFKDHISIKTRGCNPPIISFTAEIYSQLPLIKMLLGKV